MSQELQQVIDELRQAIEDLEVDGDVDGDELDAISDQVFGAWTMLNDVVLKRKAAQRDDQLEEIQGEE